MYEHLNDDAHAFWTTSQIRNTTIAQRLVKYTYFWNVANISWKAQNQYGIKKS